MGPGGGFLEVFEHLCLHVQGVDTGSPILSPWWDD